MIACKQFNEILNQIQHSGLNFQLQLSPFGAVISLKKSHVKDRKGDFIIPSSSIISGNPNNIEDLSALEYKILMLESKLQKLQNDYAYVCVHDDTATAAANKVVEAFAEKKEDTVDRESERKVPDRKKEKLEMCAETEKQKNCEYESKEDKNDKHIKDSKEKSCIESKPEIELDLNYNVKVSNSFSPLLQQVQETSSSSKPPLLTSPVSLSFRETCISPLASVNTPPSLCLASSPGRNVCSESFNLPSSPSLGKIGLITPKLPSSSSPKLPQTQATAS